ncbi:unnamed protein product [Taenia asiatica]|uniref:Uncharacterized protein n=1 Tax=Taenia asiatica TaxID=60517 RepID=A0A0R3W9X6_TAEAS|nr:unnamed protein product [Taenia asiatica]
MAGVVDVLSSSLLHLGVATSVVVFSLFIFFKYLYKRGSSVSPLKSSQKKTTHKKGEGKSNQQTAKVAKSAAKTQPQPSKDVSVNSTPRTRKNDSPKAQVPVTTEEDDWVKVKSAKSQSGQSPSKESAKAGTKSKKSDNQSKKSQKQQNKKSERSPKAENRDEEGKNSGDSSPVKSTYVPTAPAVEKPAEDEWQEIPSSKRKKQRARKE